MGGAIYPFVFIWEDRQTERGRDSIQEEWEVQLLQSSGLRGIEMNLGVLAESLGNS